MTVNPVRSKFQMCQDITNKQQRYDRAEGMLEKLRFSAKFAKMR